MNTKSLFLCCCLFFNNQMRTFREKNGLLSTKSTQTLTQKITATRRDGRRKRAMFEKQVLLAQHTFTDVCLCTRLRLDAEQFSLEHQRTKGDEGRSHVSVRHIKD